MPTDRTATLKNAEKLLRQGKLDQAIAEYLHVVEKQPRDWNTVNILGDLYVRAGQIDKAVDHFIRIADSLSDEGFLPKAGAIYKKILKLKPDDEHALLQGAEIAASQGLLADARSYLNSVAERRRKRGDQKGAAQIRVRLGSLDPDDIPARLAGARARLDLKDQEGAIRDFKELAAELSEKGKQTEAIQALHEAALLAPGDQEIRDRLLDVYVAAGDYPRARQCASTVAQFKDIAARLDAAGQGDEALLTLREAARLDPSDTELQTHLARAFIAKGDLATAAEYVTVETAGDDPQLLLTVAEIQLRAGRTDEGMALVRRVIDGNIERRQDIAMLGWAIAEQLPDIGFQLVELAADASVAQADWPSAAAVLQEFVTRVSNHIPALMRLVEICVDGGLEATMYTAQSYLADAYIAAGSASEARFIAEDLVAREPWERANIERFRRALVLSGEADPDAIIAERLSGESPFISTDLTFSGEELPPFTPNPPAEEPVAPATEPEPPRELEPERKRKRDHEPAAETQTASEPAADPEPHASAGPARTKPKAGPAAAKPKAKKSRQFELGSNAIDLESILGEMDTPATAKGRSESVEVDLSIVLDDIKHPLPPPAKAASSSGDLDDVFAQLRDDASRRSSVDDAAGEQYERGVSMAQAGRLDEAVAALEAASRAPRHRFNSASMIARIHRDRGMVPQAIEWFERAAEAPAPTAEAGHLLLYDLAAVLESAGETARALAVCMELQADAGTYRDVAARIDRLAKVQARG